SNSHTSRRWNLNPVRLPISPRPHQGTNSRLDFYKLWQRIKDSNLDERFWRPSCYHYTNPLLPPSISLPKYCWWGRRDSNSHTSRRWNLNPVRLPISPRPQWLCILSRSFPAAKPDIIEKQSFDSIRNNVMIARAPCRTSTQYSVTQISFGGDGETRTLTPRDA